MNVEIEITEPHGHAVAGLQLGPVGVGTLGLGSEFFNTWSELRTHKVVVGALSCRHFQVKSAIRELGQLWQSKVGACDDNGG
jgi:hypothetical protein